MRYQFKSHRLTVIAVFLALASLIGCEEDLAGVRLSDNAFTMFGIINPLADIQAVRIYEIDEILTPSKPEPIDAIVTSTNFTTGEVVAWQDSVISFRNGKFGHVFWAPFRPRHGDRFLLEVSRRGGGAAATATTTVPPFSAGTVLPHTEGGFSVIQPVFWSDAPNLIHIRVRYFTNVGLFEFDYNIAQQDVAGGKQVLIEMHEDSGVIFRAAFVSDTFPVQLHRMDMQVVVTDADWTPPGGVFDPNVFSVPGTFSNVENGFGFVGSGYPAILEWVPSNELRKRLGFVEQ